VFLVERLDRLLELLGLCDVLDDRVHVVAVPLQAVLHLLLRFEVGFRFFFGFWVAGLEVKV